MMKEEFGAKNPRSLRLTVTVALWLPQLKVLEQRE